MYICHYKSDVIQYGGYSSYFGRKSKYFYRTIPGHYPGSLILNVYQALTDICSTRLYANNTKKNIWAIL